MLHQSITRFRSNVDELWSLTPQYTLIKMITRLSLILASNWSVGTFQRLLILATSPLLKSHYNNDINSIIKWYVSAVSTHWRGFPCLVLEHVMSDKCGTDIWVLLCVSLPLLALKTVTTSQFHFVLLEKRLSHRHEGHYRQYTPYLISVTL